MFNFNNYSIRAKLIIIFVIFKILPLFLLASIGVYSFLDIDKLLQKSSKEIISKSQESIHSTTDSAIQDSIIALDRKSQNIIEEKTTIIATNVANFLKHRDEDILFLSKQNISQKSLEEFYNKKTNDVFVETTHIYNEKQEKWLPIKNTLIKNTYESAKLLDNSKEFHKINPKPINKKSIPIYKEIAFYNVNGEEIYKISSIDNNLKNISLKQNTYCKAENYYQESLKLTKNEIYVSNVIGEYVPSKIIGSFTKTKASKANIKFKPQAHAYAGIENPVGKKFEGIVRFVTPVYNNKILKGYLSFALDHHHIMDFTDFVDPMNISSLNISDASKGNYAFMWSSDFKAISHPRDYFIVGYDSSTGEMVPGWIDTSLYKRYKESKEESLNSFLSKQPIFLNQSLNKKSSVEQINKGQIALDCRYLNFAPQCQGWSQLTDKGGYGSFIIFWSNVWKLSTAATIPYYTGQYKNSKRGFGFVTIGANVEEFHKAATKTKEKIKTVLEKEKNDIENKILQITKEILVNIQVQIKKIGFVTLILIILIIYVAIYVSNNLSNRIKKIIIGTEKIKNKDFDYQIVSNTNDEIGKLATSFNEMSQSINSLTNDLQTKLYTDDLTGLKNRRTFWKDIKTCENPTLYLLDIDLFKNINDYFGTKAGNFVLVRFGNILQKFAEKSNMYAYRMGSDEYLLLDNIHSDNSGKKQIIKLLSNIIEKENFTDEDLNIDTDIRFTCGVSTGLGNLLEKADLALNEAKRKKVSYMEYSPTNPFMNKHKENILWKEKIIYAIANDLIVPYFQEIVDVKNPKNKKYEALIRMIDRDKVISPYFFLNVSKDTKLYPELTKIMIEKTFRKFDKIDAKCSINLSIDDITNENTIKFIDKKLKEYNVKDKLIFELLESEEISNFSEIMPFIEKMKSLGVQFAIDDFGSGYSNFSYLLQIKPDYIKIDGSLIKNLTIDSSEYHIVDAIVKFAKSLNIKIVAEHVSSQNIVTILNDFSIDYMQGFHFSEPSENLQN